MNVISEKYGYKPERKDPWEVNPFDVCKAFSKCKIVKYTIEGSTLAEAKKNLLEYFYEIEEKHVKLTNHKGLITNRPIEVGRTHNNNGEATGWHITGKFCCFIPEKIERNEEEIR